MSKKALVLTKKNKYGVYEAGRVKEEAEKMGWEEDLVYYEDVGVRIGNDGIEFNLNGSKFDLGVYSWCYSRSANISKTVKLTHLKKLMLEEMMEKGVRVLNAESFLEWSLLSKLMQEYLFVKAGLPVIELSYLNSECGFDLPVMAKKILGSMGQGVVKVNSQSEMDEVVQKFGQAKLLLQRFVENDGDARVIVLGGRAIGAMKRIPADGSYLSNISAGGKAEKLELTQELSDLAVKACATCKLEHGGVDIMYDRAGKAYILEVNRHPQFGGFEKASGINVAGKIVEYMADATA